MNPNVEIFPSAETDWITELKRVLGSAETPMVRMTPQEISQFTMETWTEKYGPAILRIGNFVIYTTENEPLSQL